MYIQFFIILIFTILPQSLYSTCICNKHNDATQCSVISTILFDVRAQLDSTQELVLDSEDTLPQNAIQEPDTKDIRILCNIKKVLEKSFANQKSLANLDLSNNLIVTIPNDMFSTIPHLRSLNLSHNKLNSPTLDTFYALHNVVQVDLSYNNIDHFKLGVLDEMDKIQNLNLRNNNLTELKLGLFDAIRTLVTLDISYNYITKIPLGLFDKSQKLQELNMAGNNFKGIVPLGTYDSFKNLKILNISNNKIESLPLGLFDKAVEVQTLDLSGNKLSSLKQGVFDTLKSLEVLSIANCQLKEISPYIFDQNSKIQSLDLSNNKFSKLSEILFHRTNTLKYLNLSHNQITQITQNVFKNTDILTIDLSFNKLNTIDLEVLNLETAENIYLQNNNIAFINHGSSPTKAFPLQSLNIRNNKLVFVDETFFLKWLPDLKNFRFLGNPWDCKCLENLVQVLKQLLPDHISNEYSSGDRPICVVGDSNTCNISNMTYYYNMFRDAMITP